MTNLFIYQFGFLGTALGSIVIALFVFLRSSKAKFNRFFILTNISAVIWAVGRFALLVVQDPDAAFIWTHVLYYGSILVHIFLLYTVLTFLELDQKRKRILLFFTVNAVFLLLINTGDLLFGTKLFIHDLMPKLHFQYYEVPGILYHLHLINYLFIPQYVFIEMLIALKKRRGLILNQIKFLLFASSLGFIGGNSVVPLVYGFKFDPILVVLSPFNFLLMAYAIYRFRIMNIRLILTKSILYFLLIAIVTTIFAFTSFFLGRLVSVTSRYAEIGIIMIVSFIVVVSLDPLRRVLAKITDDIFYKDKIDYQEVLRDLSIIIAREIDLETLLKSLRKAIVSGLKVKATDILVKRNDHFKSIDPHAVKEFMPESLLVHYLKQKHEAIITDEFYRHTYDLPESDEKHHHQEVLDELERQGIEFCMPVHLEGSMKAIIILGQKQSGDIYGNEEIRFFNNLAPQIAVAIEKSQLYESIGEFNMKLQDKINRATREIKEKNIQLEEANAHLKQLDTAKSEFLSIASHQLRTPISALKGYLSMILEGDFGKVSDSHRKVLGDLFESASRLARLVNIFLNVSRIESGKFKLDRTTVDVDVLVRGVMDELKGQVESKNLKMTYKPAKNIPKLYIDSDKVREVILNLVDNAIKYTNKGSIALRTFVDHGNLHFVSKDTGIGVRPDDARALFRKFVRGTGIAQVNTQGSGLGLYIAHRVVSEHGGRIWVESEGLDKGSTFHFMIPIMKAGSVKKPKTSEKKSEK